MFHNFPETVKNLEMLCKSANLNYLVPDTQTCCGLPYFEKGEMKAAKTIAEYNLHTFGENEMICPSIKCEDTYTIKYPKIFNNTVSHNHSVKLANAVKGLHYLFEKINLKQADKISGTYFFIPDCTIDKSLQTNWLSKFRNAHFHFAKLENTCCGGGFCLPSLNNAEAEKMTLTLLNESIEAGVTTIVTANEICLQQTINIIRKNNLPLQAMHLIDLFASAL